MLAALDRLVTRVEEKEYTHSPRVREWFCTWSNVPFTLIATLRLLNGFSGDLTGLLTVLYGLLAAAGVCSAIHHGTPGHATLVIDWLPIATSLTIVFWNGLLAYAQWSTVAMALFTLAWLLLDHIRPVTPAPWGHVLWHVSAAWAADSLYQDLLR